MANTYELIASTQLTSTSTGFTFSSIPQTYTDLEFRLSSRSDFADTNSNVIVRLNGVSTQIYRNAQMSYYSSGLNYNTSFNGNYFNNGPFNAGASLTANTYGMDRFYLPNYTSSTMFKAILGFTSITQSTGNGWAIHYHGSSADTAAVTSITVAPYSNNFISGSNFYLYGIKKS